MKLRVSRLENETLLATNRVFLNPADLSTQQVRHVEVVPAPGRRFRFSVGNDPSVQQGKIAFNALQRRFAMLSTEQEVQVTPLNFTASDPIVTMVTLATEFQQKK